MGIVLFVYLLGVVIGLLVMRDRLVPRLVTAMLWPIGPATGVLVVCGLLIVSVVLWPALMVLVAAAVGGVIYLLA